MTHPRPTMVNQELLFWSVLVVVELIVIAVLVPSGFLSFLAALAVVPVVYWPLQDSLKWPVPAAPSPGQPAAAQDPAVH